MRLLPASVRNWWPRLVQVIVFSAMSFVVPSAFTQTCGGSNPCPQPVPGGCPCNPSGLPIDNCSYPNNHGCPNRYAPAQNMCCCSGSPVLISLVENAPFGSDAFPLTTLAGGITFALTDNPAFMYPVSWTVKNSQVAFVVHLPSNYVPGFASTFDGADLFGNFTPQPPPTKGHPANGYAALLVWDQPENGGNGDGRISLEDEAVQRGIAPGGIVLWIDENHDGIAQPEEIHTLRQKGIKSIDAAQYHESNWVDGAGNQFRYTAPVHFTSGATKPSFDVFFVMGPASK